MQKKITRHILRGIVFVLLFTTLSLAQQTSFDLQQKTEPTHLEIEARLHRRQGLKAQQAGQLEEAITHYNKAIMLDPLYIEPYNDLGVVYENKGLIDTAESFYLKALELDPYYLPAHTNLALLYERKGDLKKAAEYWRKRIKLGSYDDPWTIKAIQHLKNIALIVEEISQQLQEEEILSLIEEVKANSSKKALESKRLNEKQRKVKEYLAQAEVNFKQKKYTAALNDAAVAKHLDPTNTQIDEFVEKVHNKLKETYRH